MTARIAVVYGTRPEAIKLAPVITALRGAGATTLAVCTGQHKELLENAEAAFTGKPDLDLGLMKPGQAPAEFLARCLEQLSAVFTREQCAFVIAQGDTSTAFAATLAGFHLRLPTGHVEAGLRTYRLDAPFPEEGYRQMIDRVATRLYAPTQTSADNLAKEGRDAADILVTGNTGIDACLQIAKSDLGKARGQAPLVLATTHRRESFGAPMESICRAIRRIADAGAFVVLPLHPNPNVQHVVRKILDGHPRIELTEALPYPTLIKTMLAARCVITDSGGIQEEAPTLGVPALVTRETTERPEAVEAGSAILVGHDEERIVREALRLFQDDAHHAAMAMPRPVFGDGNASGRIAADVLRWLQRTKE